MAQMPISIQAQWKERLQKNNQLGRRIAYPARKPTCGHPNRPHLARNMCSACYLQWYNIAGGKEIIKQERAERVTV